MPNSKVKYQEKLTPKAYRKMLLEGASMEEVFRVCFTEKNYRYTNVENREAKEEGLKYYPLRKTA